MRLLVLSDLHLSPGGKPPAFERLSAYTVDDVEGVMLLGDVIDKTDENSIDLGREVIAGFADAGLPVLSVPGNHDHLPDHRRLVSGIDGARLLHGTAITLVDRGAEPVNEGADDSLRIVGWGCEEFDQRPAVSPPWDTEPESAPVSPARIDAFVDTLAAHIQGDAPLESVEESLGIADPAGFGRGIKRLLERHRPIASALSVDGPLLVGTHVPPFGTGLDVSRGAGDSHRGSVALRLALEERSPIAVCCGHFHREEYDLLDGTHLLNPGYRGGAVVEVDPRTAGFSYDPISLSE